METSRQEYPQLLNGLQPSQAVALVNNRVEYIGRLNNDIAEWLEERRRVEELYASSLRKLARRKLGEDSMGLGAFSSAWQRIVSSVEELAASHHTLARGIEHDVVGPLRNFSANNREMQSMSTIQGNLASMAREVEGRNGKSGRGRNGSVDNATEQWDSQAPYVMEQLQAVDESRCNHLRDVLTQYQTHEVDQVERNRLTAEQCLNALLTVETADEIKMFAVRYARDGGGAIPESTAPRTPASRMAERNTRMPPRTDTNSSLTVPGAFPHAQDDRASQRSASIHEEEKKKGGLRGLKRLGTVLKGKRNSMLPGSSSTPPSKNRKEVIRSPSPGFFPSPAIRENDSEVSTPTREAFGNPNAGIRESPAVRDERVVSPAPTNGTHTTQPEGLQAPLQPQSYPMREQSQPLQSQSFQSQPQAFQSQPQAFPSQPQAFQSQAPASQAQDNDLYEAPQGPPPPAKDTTTDADGFSAPPARYDPFSAAEQEAASANGNNSRQYDVDIRNAPIAEEDGDAGAASASLASTLRAQAAPQRRTTTRGRRDVRNTMFLASSPTGGSFPEEQPPLPSIPQQHFNQSTMPAAPSSSSLIVTPFIASIAGGQSPAVAPRPFPGLDRADSDSQSIQSGRSSVMVGDALSKHAEMSQQGLNVSMVETISAWFEQGSVTRAVVIGEMALAHNAGSFPNTSSTESIRIDNFAALEKVAPNPAFISQQGSQGGEYSIDISSLSRAPQIGFKYQVHVDAANFASYAPINLSPMWRVEPTQTSVILSYSLNPAIASTLSSPIYLNNVTISISLDTSDASAGRAMACQSKPAGTFSRERGTITWRLGSVTLTPGAPAEKLLARFSTEGQGRQGKVEVRWEISSAPETLGSGLGVSVLESGASIASASADPFADEDAGVTNGMNGGAGSWRQVRAARKLVSGTYQAN